MSIVGTITYERDEAGLWVATAEGVPGCHTQGKTLEEARERIKEAIAVSLPSDTHGVFVEQMIVSLEQGSHAAEYTAYLEMFTNVGRGELVRFEASGIEGVRMAAAKALGSADGKHLGASPRSFSAVKLDIDRCVQSMTADDFVQKVPVPVLDGSRAVPHDLGGSRVVTHDPLGSLRDAVAQHAPIARGFGTTGVDGVRLNGTDAFVVDSDRTPEDVMLSKFGVDGAAIIAASNERRQEMLKHPGIKEDDDFAFVFHAHIWHLDENGVRVVDRDEDWSVCDAAEYLTGFEEPPTRRLVLEAEERGLVLEVARKLRNILHPETAGNCVFVDLPRNRRAAISFTKPVQLIYDTDSHERFWFFVALDHLGRGIKGGPYGTSDEAWKAHQQWIDETQCDFQRPWWRRSPWVGGSFGPTAVRGPFAGAPWQQSDEGPSELVCPDFDTSAEFVIVRIDQGLMRNKSGQLVPKIEDVARQGNHWIRRIDSSGMVPAMVCACDRKFTEAEAKRIRVLP